MWNVDVILVLIWQSYNFSNKPVDIWVIIFLWLPEKFDPGGKHDEG